MTIHERAEALKKKLAEMGITNDEELQEAIEATRLDIALFVNKPTADAECKEGIGMKFSKRDEEGRVIRAGRSTRRIESALEVLASAIIGVGMAALLAQVFGIAIGVITP